MSENCIVSFANHKGRYVQNMARLSESLRNNFDGDFMAFTNEASIGSPSHFEVPYAFKIYAINKAIECGYKKILYLDSSCFAIKNVQPCFDYITSNGFIFQDAGHYASTWINDFSLNYFGITREQAKEIKLIGNAGLLGLNLEMGLPQVFFQKWIDSMKAGCFNGKWDNTDKTESQDEECRGHRHDMVSGIIIHQMGLFRLAFDGDKLLQYAGLFDEVANETIIFKAQG